MLPGGFGCLVAFHTGKLSVAGRNSTRLFLGLCLCRELQNEPIGEEVRDLVRWVRATRETRHPISEDCTLKNQSPAWVKSQICTDLFRAVLPSPPNAVDLEQRERASVVLGVTALPTPSIPGQHPPSRSSQSLCSDQQKTFSL
jgi:hypothetical protein